MVPYAFADGSFACCPFAVIEVRHIPILHSGWQCDVTESPVGEFFQFVLRFGGIDRDDSASFDPAGRGLPIGFQNLSHFRSVSSVPSAFNV